MWVRQIILFMLCMLICSVYQYILWLSVTHITHSSLPILIAPFILYKGCHTFKMTLQTKKQAFFASTWWLVPPVCHLWLAGTNYHTWLILNHLRVRLNVQNDRKSVLLWQHIYKMTGNLYAGIVQKYTSVPSNGGGNTDQVNFPSLFNRFAGSPLSSEPHRYSGL